MAISTKIKSRIKLIFCFFFVLFFQIFCFAETHDLYEFKTAAQQEKFQQLILELRCLVCQNQTLADSQAPLAADLRKEVYEMVKQNKSRDEIIKYLTERYGNFILYKPPLKTNTFFLWMFPIFLLFIIFAILFWIIKKSHKRI